jgi:hypothetical protein
MKLLSVRPHRSQIPLQTFDQSITDAVDYLRIGVKSQYQLASNSYSDLQVAKTNIGVLTTTFGSSLEKAITKCIETAASKHGPVPTESAEAGSSGDNHNSPAQESMMTSDNNASGHERSTDAAGSEAR